MMPLWSVGYGILLWEPMGVIAQADGPGLTPVELVCVDKEATGYATFQSHNQKVVSNRHGIFMTHIRTRNEAYTAQQWRLIRSVDGGRRFSILYESTNATNPPVVETDQAGTVYLARPDFVDGHAYLYRFLARDGYAKPVITKIPGGAAGKYCMIVDGARKRLYYFAHNNTFHVLGLDGKVLSSRRLLRQGAHAVLQYPLLSLARDGALHAAWTTQKHGQYLYWDIHHMLSRDGGRSWANMGGKSIEPPVIADDGGAARRITLADEFEVHTWLSNMMVKDQKVHFLYMAQTKPAAREHYVRYDAKTGKEDFRIQPGFRGDSISLLGLSGFFAARPSLRDGPLYCVSSWKGRIACLASDDNGRTWYDYAVSDKTYHPYSIGGCRELTADGQIIGSFTDQSASPANVSGKCPVYFLWIRAGLSRARVAAVDTVAGAVAVRFADVRGQPAAVRFQDKNGAWGGWVKFQEEVKLDDRPEAFQLRSRLGVISRAYRIAKQEAQYRLSQMARPCQRASLRVSAVRAAAFMPRGGPGPRGMNAAAREDSRMTYETQYLASGARIRTWCENPRLVRESAPGARIPSRTCLSRNPFLGNHKGYSSGKSGRAIRSILRRAGGTRGYRSPFGASREGIPGSSGARRDSRTRTLGRAGWD